MNISGNSADAETCFFKTFHLILQCVFVYFKSNMYNKNEIRENSQQAHVVL